MNKKPLLILTGTIAGTVDVLSYAPSSSATAATLTPATIAATIAATSATTNSATSVLQSALSK